MSMDRDEATRMRYEQGLTWKEAANMAGMTESTLKSANFRQRKKQAAQGIAVPERQQSIEVPVLPSDVCIDELKGRKRAEFRRKAVAAEARKLIPIKIKHPGVLSLLFFGDLHLDDPGTDIDLCYHHAALTHIDGVYGVSIGDHTNNWVGRLARLYGNQSTTAAEAIVLCEDFLKSARWAFIISGNHDTWSGAGDIVRWVSSQAGALHGDHQLRCQLRFPQGDPLTIVARHNFAGNSQYSASFGANKASMLDPNPAELYVNGHTHVSGYNIRKNGKILSHALQLSSYKQHDTYAAEHGFQDQHVSPAVLVTIDPLAGMAGRVMVHHDVDVGVEYHKWRMGRA